MHRRMKYATHLPQPPPSPAPLRPCSKRVSTKFLRSGSRHRPRVRAYRAFHEATTDIRRRFATPQYRYYLFRMWSHIIVGLRRRPSQRSPPGSAPAIVGAQARSRATCSRRGQRYSPSKHLGGDIKESGARTRQTGDSLEAMIAGMGTTTPKLLLL